MSKPLFGRISLDDLKEQQDKLLKMLDQEIKPLEFITQYNKATLGLVRGEDQVIKILYQLELLNEHKRFLKYQLPLLLGKAISRALKYYGEVGKVFEKIPTTKLEEEARRVFNES